MTQREKLVKALFAMGWRQVPYKSKQYLVFAKAGVPDNMYVGKAGALRAGTTIAGSRSISENVRQQFLTLGGRS